MSERARRAVEALALVVLFGLVAIYASRPIWDIDVFWQVVTGRIITETRAIPRTDILSSIEPEREWATLEWLYGVLVFWLDRAGGLTLVRFWHSAIQWVAFVCFWWGARHRLRLPSATSFALVALYVVLYSDRFRERAHVFNLLFWTLLFPWLFEGPKKLDRTRIAVTALVVFLWANLHSGGALIFVIAALCLPAGALVEWLARRHIDERAVLIRSIAFHLSLSVAALVAPNFIRSSIHIVTLLGEVDVFIPEWRPTWHYLVVGTIPGHYVCGAFPTLWALVVAWTTAKPVAAFLENGRAGLTEMFAVRGPHGLMLAIAMLVLSHRALRFVEFATYAVVFSIPHLEARLPASPVLRVSLERALLAAAAALVAIGYQSRISFLYGGSLTRAIATAFGERPILEGRFPEAAGDFLVRTGFEGGVFVQPKWGGYLLYRLWPQATVSSDGRGTFSKAAMDDHWATSAPNPTFDDPQNGPRVEAIYARHATIDAVVSWHPAFPPGYSPKGFVLVYTDRVAEVWVRNDTARGRAYLPRARAR
ncbi:MAG: hypothetical protein HYV07_00665 [Deltaproteobacteria bacterium]|nr:hypothetical protein [Deltaproteobacteria bacterium]